MIEDQNNRLNALQTAFTDGLAERLKPIADALSPVATHLQGLQGAFEAFQPEHSTVEQTIAFAESCPGCAQKLEELESSIKGKLEEAQRKVVPVAPASPQPPPAAAPPQAPPVAEPKAKAAPKPKVFSYDDKLNTFALRAHGLELIEDGSDEIRVAVRRGWDDEAEEGMKELIEDGALPKGCVIAVGPDGKTKMVCEGEVV